MATELKNIHVDFLSLVSKGANGKRIIYKSDGDRPKDAEEIEAFTRSFLKSDDDRRMVYAVVYSPEEVDSQGEFAKADEIEAAAYGFMKSRNVLNVDTEHDFDPKAAFVAESWLVKSVDPLFPKEREGAWAVGIRVEDQNLWARVKKGELEGISMAGYAAKIRKSGDEGGMWSKFEAVLSRVLKGNGKESPANPKDETQQIDELVSKIAKAVSNETAEDFKKQFDALSERVERMEKATPGKTGGSVDDDGSGGGTCGIA